LDCGSWYLKINFIVINLNCYNFKFVIALEHFVTYVCQRSCAVPRKGSTLMAEKQALEINA